MNQSSWLRRKEEDASFQQQAQLTGLTRDSLWKVGLTALKQGEKEVQCLFGMASG